VTFARPLLALVYTSSLASCHGTSETGAPVATLPQPSQTSATAGAAGSTAASPPPTSAPAASAGGGASRAAEPKAPASFRVSGVAADDVLNLRSEPDAEAPLRGGIPAWTTHVEGVGEPTTVGAAVWQRVQYAGVTGWVNARFLARNPDGPPPQPPPPSRIEVLTPLLCFGTEPFWSLHFGADGAVICGAACEAPVGLRVTKVLANREGEPDGFDLADSKGSRWMRAVVSRTGKCTDGMSDNVYPFEFTGSVSSGNFIGCCRRLNDDP